MATNKNFPVRNVGKQSNSDYTHRMRAGQINHAGMAVHWYRKTISHADLTAGATSQALNLNTLFPNDPFPEHVTVMPGSLARLIQLFAGGAVSAATAVVGFTGTTNAFLTSTNVFTGQALGVKQTAQSGAGMHYAALAPLVTIATTSANVTALTTGILEVMIPYTPTAWWS